MSEGNTKPPTNPVVAEAHEVDTFRESSKDKRSQCSQADKLQIRQRRCS